MPLLDEAPILELGKAPIPGDRPCGVDAAEDERYIAVGAEMSKLGRIDAGEPNWYVIEQNAINVLRSKAKDAEVASWLGHALFKRYSYAGLAAALALLTQLTSNFWEGCYPQRPRRRRARIEELVNRFVEQKWFDENPPKPQDFDALDICVTRAEELKNALSAKMPEEPADFTKFVRGLKTHADKRPKAAAAGAVGAEGQPAGARPAGPGFTAGEIADAGGAINAILAASTFLRKADPTDPIPYAIARVLKWSKLSLPATPGAVDIPPPETTLVEALTHQFNNGVWEHLLKNAEGAFRSNDPLWLDLQRYVCAAMKGLGPGYDKAREAVLLQTSGLVGRLGDGLYELRFRNGVPLCGGETRMWLEAEAAPKGRGGPAATSDPAGGALSETLSKARKLAGAGNLKDALKELNDGCAACTQHRDRVIWRLRTAQLCYDAQRLQIAAPLLEECFEEIKRYRVDEWEPALAVDVAQALYRCRKALMASDKAPTPEALQRVRESFAWLCQLDPLAALAVEPSDK